MASVTFTKTKYTGVEYRVNQDGAKTYYIRYKRNGKLIREKVGTDLEGITAQYCNQYRAKQTSIERLGDLAPSEIAKAKNKQVPTVKQMADQYLNTLKDLSDYDATVGRYDNHLHQEFGRKLLTEITSEDIEKFVLKKRREVSFKTGRPYANKTINDMVNLLNAIYNYSIANHGINIVPPTKSKRKKEQGIGIVRLTEDNARQRYLHPDEIQRLYLALDQREGNEELSEDLKLLVRLALSTGARLTSLLNIRKRDVNLKNKSVTIKDLKNDSTYTGYLHDSLLPLLVKRLDELNPNNCLIGGEPTPKHRSGINKALQPVLDGLFNVGLNVEDAQNRVVVHTLRHTFGSLLAINGTPIFTIQKLMNHKSIEMTMRYAKLAPDQGKDQVRGLLL